MAGLIVTSNPPQEGNRPGDLSEVVILRPGTPVRLLSGSHGPQTDDRALNAIAQGSLHDRPGCGSMMGGAMVRGRIP